MHDDTATRAALASALRREVEGLTPGTAPVDAVLRQGRARRRRRGAAAACAVVAAVAVPLTVLAWPPETPDPPRYAAPPASSSPSATPAPTAGTLKVLEPYEGFTVSDGWQLGMLPEGRQNYILEADGQFAASMELRRDKNIGASIRPNSFSGPSLGTGNPLVSGAWRLAQPPQRITLTTESGREYLADLFTLPDNPGWGVYTFHGTDMGPEDTFTVTGYDARGKVFQVTERTPTWPPPRKGS